MERNRSVSSSSKPCDFSTMTGLRLGRRKEQSSCFPAKRSRPSNQNTCCQVEGCDLDLKSAKDYHRRHRICESHSKSPRVVVSGMERRFCQQCSRFHDLSEFDDNKRSCRRRLSDHNARRRRVQPESSVRLLPNGLSSSALYDQRRQQNLLLNGLPNSRWEDANTYMLRQGLIRPSELLRMDLDKLCPIQSSNQRVLDQCLQIPSTNVIPDLINARSLLSSNPWSLNEGQSTSACGGGLVHGNYNSNNNNNVLLMRKSNSEPAFQSHSIIYNPVEQGPAAVTMVHSVNEGISHQQEYQLLKADAHDSTGFCSGRRDL